MAAHSSLLSLAGISRLGSGFFYLIVLKTFKFADELWRRRSHVPLI
jgi:hypothetical protein